MGVVALLALRRTSGSPDSSDPVPFIRSPSTGFLWRACNPAPATVSTLAFLQFLRSQMPQHFHPRAFRDRPTSVPNFLLPFISPKSLTPLKSISKI